jgi:hypothetical protein
MKIIYQWLLVLCVLAAIFGLCASAFSQIPAPQINLTGNIGCQGFPCLNTGTLSLTTDANHTMTAQETSAFSFKVTSTVSFTATRNLIFPSGRFPLGCVENATTGGQILQVIGTSGTGVPITNGTTVCGIWNDGTNFVTGASSGGSGITALTGDVSASGTGSVAATLATVNSNVGTCGDSTHVGVSTLNAKGLTTACTPIAITSTLPTSLTGVATNGSGVAQQQTPANVASIISSQTGCTTAGNTWSPATNTCIASGGADFPSTNGFVVNTSTTAARTATSADAFGLINYTAGESMYFFGDSTVAGTGASVLSKAFASVLSADYGGTGINKGISGATEGQIDRVVLNSLTITDYNSMTRVLIEGGINDANNGCSTTACLTDFSQARDAGIAYAGLLYNQRIMASQATQTGSWTALAFVQPLAGQVGTALSSSTPGSTLTFTLNSSTVGSVGNFVGVTWAEVSSDTATFTVSIDGTLETNACTGTASFNTAPCGSNNGSFAPVRQEFAVTGTTHTVVITTAGTGAVDIIDADMAPTAPSAIAPVVLSLGVPFQFNNTDSAATAAYNTAAASTTALMLSQNAKVVFVDLRNGAGAAPGVNSTTDMSSTNPLCSGGAEPLHYNDCGHFKVAQIAESAAAAAGFAFTIPNTGGRSGAFTTPLTTAGATGNNTIIQDWNPNLSGQIGLASGITWATNNFSTFMARTGFGTDVNGNFSVQTMTTAGLGVGFYTCSTSFPTSQSQCTPTFFVSSAGAGKFSGSVTTPSFTLNGAQAQTGVQGSTGTKLFSCTGTFVVNDLVSIDTNGNCVDSGILTSSVPFLTLNNTWTAANQFNGVTSFINQINQLPATPATSSANISSPNLTLISNYWTGTATAADDCVWSTIPATGNNPLIAMQLTCTGSPGGHILSIAIPTAVPSLNSTGLVTASNIAKANTPVTFTGTGSGVTIACSTGFTCTSKAGNLTVTSTTFTTGTVATVVWPATPLAPSCSVTQSGGTLFDATGNGVPTTTGFSLTVGISIIGTTQFVQYMCVPNL